MKAIQIRKPKWLASKEAKSVAINSLMIGALFAAGPASANDAVITAMTDLFTQIGTWVGTLMLAAATLFGLIRGGQALFKVASKFFGVAGA